jgi:hypothetical protein
MADIYLDSLSLLEAEEAMAEIWGCLEEYNIPSPKIFVDARSNSRIAIKLRFEEPLWAEVVAVRLSTLIRDAPRKWISCPSAPAKRGGVLYRTAGGSPPSNFAQVAAISSGFRAAKRRG